MWSCIFLSKRIFLFSVLLLSFVFIGMCEYFLVNATAFTQPHDNDTSFFGLGLNWLTWQPEKNYHHPAPFFTLLSGAIAYLSGPFGDHGAVLRFNELGVWLNFGWLILVAIWSVFIAETLNITRRSFLLALLIIVAFPSTILYTYHFSDYFWLALLSLPMALSLLGVFSYNKFHLSAGVSVGFAVGNYYPFLLVLGLVAILLMFCRQKTVIDIKALSHREQLILPTIGAFWLGYVVFTGGNIISTNQTAILAGVCGSLFLGFITIWFAQKILIVNHFEKRFWFSFIVTVMLVTNVMADYYVITLVQLALNVIEGDGATNVGKIAIDPWPMFSYYIFLSFIIVAIVSRLREKGGSLYEEHKNLITLVFAGLCLTLPITTLVYNETQISGLTYRLGLPSLVFLILATYILFSYKKVRLFFIPIFLIFATVSIADTANQFYGALEDNERVGGEIDIKIDAFLNSNSSGVVICLRDDLRSQYCGTGYAYNSYRTKESLKVWSTYSLYNGRLYWANLGGFPETWQLLKKENELEKTKIMLVGEYSRFEEVPFEYLAGGDILFSTGSVKMILLDSML